MTDLNEQQNKLHRKGWRLPVWAQPAELMDLFRLSVPIAFSRSAAMIMAFTDTIILARYAPAEVPYIALSWVLISIGLSVSMGLLNGIQVFTAELNEVGERHNTGRVLRRGLLTAFGIGFVFAIPVHFLGTYFYDLLQQSEKDVAGAASAARILGWGMIPFAMSVGCTLYLEALRMPRIATIAMFIACFVNLGFNILLVAGAWGMPAMGADGVAWATTGTRTFLTIYLLIMIAILTPGLKKSAAAPIGEAYRQFRVGIGTAMSNFIEFTSFSFIEVIAGWISRVAITAFAVSTQFLGLTFMLYMGLGSATTVRVAEAYARKDGVGVQNANRLGAAVGIIAGIFMGALIYIFHETLANWMFSMSEGGGHHDDENARFVALALPETAALIAICGAIVVFDGMQGLASMVLRAQNVVWLPVVIHFICFTVIMLPLSYYLGITLDRGAFGLGEAVLITVIISAIAQCALLEYSGRRFAKADKDSDLFAGEVSEA